MLLFVIYALLNTEYSINVLYYLKQQIVSIFLKKQIWRNIEISRYLLSENVSTRYISFKFRFSLLLIPLKRRGKNQTSPYHLNKFNLQLLLLLLASFIVYRYGYNFSPFVCFSSCSYIRHDAFFFYFKFLLPLLLWQCLFCCMHH